MTHEYFMEKAVELSLENMRAGKGGPFGAIIVRQGKIVGTGANHVTSDNDPTAHAEVVAIRDACKNLGTFQLDDCEIYTSCEPCLYEEIKKNLEERSLPIHQLDKSNALKVFDERKRKTDKIEY